MRPLTRISVPHRAAAINKSVIAAENILRQSRKAAPLPISDRLMHMTASPYRSFYLSSPVERLYDFLLDFDPVSINPGFKAKKAGVLGGGLLASACVLADFFKVVTSWEIDPLVWRASLKVAEDMGFSASRIETNLADMFKYADLKAFDLLYFFEPVFDNAGKLGTLLKKADPGAIIACPILTLPEHYDHIFPSDHFVSRGTPSTLKFMFDIYQRT